MERAERPYIAVVGVLDTFIQGDAESVLGSTVLVSDAE